MARWRPAPGAPTQSPSASTGRPRPGSSASARCPRRRAPRSRTPSPPGAAGLGVRSDRSLTISGGGCRLRPTMIKVHKFGPAFGLPDASPFVHKVETYLRLTDQKYETVNADVRKAPRSQLPYIEVDGKKIP